MIYLLNILLIISSDAPAAKAETLEWVISDKMCKINYQSPGAFIFAYNAFQDVMAKKPPE